MTEPCCSSDLPARSSCPQCGSSAAPVDVVTVKALLTARALRSLQLGPFHFCADPACDFVYFSADQRFRTAEVRVPVWQKEPFGARVVCYCFGENEAEMRREIEETGVSAAASRVREHIAAERCACEIRNPRGACCLGDVIAAVKRVETARQAPEPVRAERTIPGR